MGPKKRPLARRSCLKCREKKARCELPDVYVDSSKTPLPTDKQCHRCNVLGIECIVWDGDRKRKPKLDYRSTASPSSSVERGRATSSNESAAKDSGVAHHQTSNTLRAARSADGVGPSAFAVGPSQNADGEQLAASDLSHAQSLLINRQRGWKTLSTTLHTLIERLQRKQRYDNYLKMRIDTPPSTPDIVTFLQPDKMVLMDLQLQDYLVGHPYLPSLTSLHRQQSLSANRPRALLLATLTLLALKGLEDELSSPDARNLSNYVDRLGTQMLLSSPRDIHLVMAFELLLSHEPGLVGTAASQFELDGRGFGLASENLLTCSLRIARELKLDDSITSTQQSSSKGLTHLSLWCCLRSWEALYAFLGQRLTIIDDLDVQFAANAHKLLYNVDEEGQKLPSPPRLQDPNGPTTKSYNEMREFCSSLEKKHGRDGILRSAGRTVICKRVETACCFLSGLRQLQETISDAQLSQEEKHQRYTDLHWETTGRILSVRDRTDEALGVYAGQRLVRLWEQFVHIECAFFSALIGSHHTSCIFSGKLEGSIDATELMRSVRFRLSGAQHISEVGAFGMEMSRALLSGVAQLDRQPVLHRSNSQAQISPRYLQRLPTLLLCAMTVHGARRCLESIAFVLVAWARTSSDASLNITVMEASAQSIRRLLPESSKSNADTVAQISADYIDEMIEMAQLWQVFYRVYRPVSSLRNDQTSKGVANRGTSTQAEESFESHAAADADGRSVRAETSAMDFLASAAEAVQGSGALNTDPTRAVNQQVRHTTTTESARVPEEASRNHPSANNESMSEEALFWNLPGLEPSHAASTASVTPTPGHSDVMDASMFDACIPFDLEAFLKDVDQLF
ncbi:hypothetical protein NDA14_003306 [Ustilago hordei]|nr:hypothetical protein NDA14_003306 [Ustilago hordei]